MSPFCVLGRLRGVAALFMMFGCIFAVQNLARAWDTQAMIQDAATLAADSQTYGQDADGTTHCNQFVQAWFKLVTGSSSADLNGLANDIMSNLAGDGALWTEITNSADWAATYSAATLAAKNGQIVIAAWQNPSPSATDHGHVAIVLPQDQMLGYANIATINDGNGYLVPMIAEASTINRDCTTTGVDASVRLSCGFGANKQSAIRFFAYNPTK